MKKVWKWILGIVIVVVIVAALAVLMFVLHNSFGGSIGFRNLPGHDWRAPMMDADDGWRHPMMGYRSFMPFGGGLMLFGMGLVRLIPLVLLGLLVYGAYRYGMKRSSAATPPPAAPAPTPVRTCPKCGYAVQEGWNHCANCGKKL
jgi:uncharacterized membrane protein